MTVFNLRIADDNVLKKLDEIVEKEKFKSRNQLINEILTEYVTCKSDLFGKALLPVVKSLCDDEIKELSSKADTTLDTIVPIFVNLLNKMDLLIASLNDENSN